MSKKSVVATAIIGGLLVFGIKLYTWYISGSIALLSDALESIVNILASLMMFISVWISEQPPDDDHHYGHQKIENISSFVEGLLIIIAGLLIGREAYGRLLNPLTLESLNYAIILSLLATGLNGSISWILMNKAKETNSMALEADSLHLLSDVVSSIGVAGGLYIGHIMNMPVLDPLIALVVAVIVLKIGGELILKAGKGLMDESCDEAEEALRKLMNRHQRRFIEYHNLRTRKSGDKVYAELHLRLHGGLTVQEAHDFTDHLEENVKVELPHIYLTIHIEPEKK
jgi:cation diffusion facilitator family transporter